MKSERWDRRYDGGELVWSAGPNIFVADACAGLSPGTALDLAAGEGRNALWLAERGWQVTAVDFSQVAVERMRSLAAVRLGEEQIALHTMRADLFEWSPPAEAFDLVLLVYLQVPAHQRRQVVRAAATAVAPGGQLIVVAHHTDNLTNGYGGPSDPAVLYTPEDLLIDLEGSALAVRRADRVDRIVDTPAGQRVALDTLAVFERR